MAGNSVIACHADTRLVVFLEDAQKNLYLPGNQVLGTGPYLLHVEAWSPRGLASVRAVGPAGVIAQKPLSGTHIDEDLAIELGPMDWVIVEIRGNEPYTGAIANAFFRTEF
ncbi:MAG: hypothetical protein JNM63_14920 [Spirochaetia bacterium]|nr:hypothetical protein [Spirochaetia bacterium]